jgi:enoyl-CoA hydratase/carnithine racemase
MTTVETRDEGGIRLITMNRPGALNAFSNRLMDELTEAFQAASGDDHIRVVVLTGAGRAFSAGADLTEMGRPASEPPRHGFAGLLDTLIDFPKPFIVAINGVGAGIGATICGLADFCIMAEGARLRCPFSALGLTAEAASTYLFPRLMGRQQASWFLLAAEWMSADECLESGLVMAVLPDDQLMSGVMTRARALAALPLASLMTTKKLIMDPLREQMRASAKAENEGLAGLVGGPANREALAAFREKRDPDFSGI